MKTLLLDTVTWDLCLDTNGNIAVASNPYSLAQDASSAIRLFEGELWYDKTKGIPYFAQVLGQLPPLSLVKSLLISAAMSVPEVTDAVCYISAIENRELKGQVQVSDSNSARAVNTFAITPPQVLPAVTALPNVSIFNATLI